MDEGRRQAKSPGAERTEVQLRYIVLEALPPVASTDNHHDGSDCVIIAQGGPLTACNGDLFPSVISPVRCQNILFANRSRPFDIDVKC
jgi:hypothetical protein